MKISNNKLPRVGEFVKVTVTEFVELVGAKGAYCDLVHYENKQALLLPTEAVKVKYQKIEKAHKLGSDTICLVLSVSGNNVDLSYRKVTNDDNQENIKKFMQLEKLFNVVEQIIKYYKEYNNLLELDFEKQNELYDTLFWKYTDGMNESGDEPIDYSCIYDTMLENPTKLFEDVDSDILSDDFKMNALNFIKQKITLVPYTVSTEVKLYVVNGDGVNALKKILLGAFGNDTIELYSLPTYKITFKASTQDEITDKIDYYENKLKELCNEHNGKYNYTKEHKIVHDRSFIFAK